MEEVNYKTCRQCNATLLGDEIAIYRKLVFRQATNFLCIDCLAKKLDCPRQAIDDRIKYYRESGSCTLFV